MIVAANYANTPYKKTQEYCTRSAYSHGIDKVFEYGPEDIDSVFWNCNRKILEQKRGGGYWLWKPYIIDKTLKEIDYGDYLFYIDSGSYFIRNANSLVECMEKNADDIVTFAVPFIERQWTKREIFKYFDCESDESIVESCQRIATFIILKKTLRTVKIIEQYLAVAQKENLITDELDKAIQYDDFIENRHDQSLFSIIAKRENIPVYKDPSEYGVQPKLLSQSYKDALFKDVQYAKGSYKQILVLHRKKKVTLYVRIMSFVRRKVNWRIYRSILKVQSYMIKLLKGN